MNMGSNMNSETICVKGGFIATDGLVGSEAS